MNVPRFETITPVIAAKYLESNHSNRTMRAKYLQGLIRDMTTNSWRRNGESIKFDIHGRLIDGQHRLTACVKSGCAFESLVVRGLPGDAYTSIDIGISKAFSDFLHPQGEANSTLLAAIVRWVSIWQTGQLYGAGTIWQCEICGRKARLVSDYRDGWVWQWM